MAAWSLVGLSALGLALSFYFSLAYYGRLARGALSPALCREEERSCRTILRTPYARLFGVPNALLGIGFYLLTGLVGALLLSGSLPGWLGRVSLAASAGTVLTAPYLVWALRVRLQVWCGL